MPNYTLHVVSHTHWDREWYLPFQVFRLKLVDLIDKLLDLMDGDPEFKYFHFDGQCILLEDYLQIRPENETRLREYVRQGRILVGPWYQLNDQFLVSAEANVRSLLVGTRIARDFGGVMQIGYSPDQFGNISQLPQILRGFGIDNAIFGRGLQLMGHPKMEFHWESPDGSRVLASVMPLWYNNAQHIPADPEKGLELVNSLIERMAPVTDASHLLLMNGVDHLEAQYDLTEAIRTVNERLTGAKLVQTTMPAFVDALKADLATSGAELEVVRGELREDNKSQVLAGTLSTRMYLKQANHLSQTRLERYAEPLCSAAWMRGARYPAGELDYAWRLLMQNHPHDSICGCSIDQVHKEMEVRFDQVGQIAEDLSARAMQSLAAEIGSDGDAVVVFNTLAWKRTDKVRAYVDFPLGELVRGGPKIGPTIKVNGLELRDAGGNPVPFAVIDMQTTVRRVFDPAQLPMAQMVRRFLIEFVAEDVPACGYKTYKVAVADRVPKFDGSVASEFHGAGALDNGQIRVRFDRGAIAVQRLSENDGEGETYSNINVFEDGADPGDEYRYFKPIQDMRVTSLECDARLSLIDHSPISATVKIEQTLMLPEGVTSDARARSETLVPCPIATYVTLVKGVPRVDFRVEVQNNANDHRLRALFPTGLKTDFSHAEGQFDVVTRPIAIPPEWDFAASYRPQQSWVDVNDGRGGICVINKGLPEYELYGDESRTLALTLLRCVGRLSGGAESTVSRQTPDAQCIGKHVFEYSVYPHAGTWEEARVWRQAHERNVPFYVTQIGPREGRLPSELSFVEVEPAELVVTAIKKAEGDDRLIVRFFNVTDKAVEGSVTVPGAKSAELTDLSEQAGETLNITESGSVKLKVGRKKIVTVGFGF
ncbi:MAG: glycoside hydrolase family 38 C-terminal domain-containing protein [Armatimonadota bacterium]|nr:glycoside hydrolase family 38 C-terminal domain-containing protein [Armatimonadota bacterium]